MAKRGLQTEFRCSNCPVWDVKGGSEPGWGMCCYDNTLPETYEKHWCLQGMRLVENDEKD